jgi:hypothetical protein
MNREAIIKRIAEIEWYRSRATEDWAIAIFEAYLKKLLRNLEKC